MIGTPISGGGGEGSGVLPPSSFPPPLFLVPIKTLGGSGNRQPKGLLADPLIDPPRFLLGVEGDGEGGREKKHE